MKTFYGLFAYATYYPGGGFNDFVYKDVVLAEVYHRAINTLRDGVDENGSYNVQIVNMTTNEIIFHHNENRVVIDRMIPIPVSEFRGDKNNG